ncbi:hypothetical protein [Candidatus Uabimicrobium amorphum]|uniref:Uncharacterized protein n=1 Tax=Uabimicrobium amorphum TaxID=2596890 RepID=A0A5S9IMH5_UABAM|nr:hypothetical protein [Candidatus Uabimicrobium amorphum]BBM84434.1 hypothetical protein UABAM_02794 [Candidatus Uabimicrobium amorphum]
MEETRMIAPTKQEMMIIDDFVGSTSGSPSRRTTKHFAIVGQAKLVVLIHSNVQVTLTIHEGIDETAPGIGTSIAQTEEIIEAGCAKKIEITLGGKWVILDVLSDSGDATIQIFATARAF